MERVFLVAVLVWVVGVGCLTGLARADSDGRLAIEIEMTGGSFEVGERIDFDIVLKNPSGDSLRFFHPAGPPYSGWEEWKLGVLVEDPGGREWEFVPSREYWLMRIPRIDDFRWLGPGEELRFAFEIRPLSEAGEYAETTVRGGGEEWYVSIPLTFDPWTVDRDSLSEATGIIRFDTYSVSRGKTSRIENYLQIVSVLEAIFRHPGFYRIRAQYENRTSEGIYNDEVTGQARFADVEGCWTGALSAAADLRVRARDE
ncbi:MAG: hypothetical protein JSW50_05785 [Candidatus Latescibacterota bacterium]|nr:MAG: hypothetical protein JSW50_05785 [Candidatus Latescibacterota bacterium]